MIMKYNRKLILRTDRNIMDMPLATLPTACVKLSSTPQWSAIRKSCLIRPTPDRLS